MGSTADRLKGKRVAIIGLSTEGKDALKFLVGKVRSLDCFDQRSEDALRASDATIFQTPSRYHVGPGYLETLAENGYDLLVRTPGISPRAPQLLEAKQRGGEITSVTKLFFELCPAPIIGVTGTKGKGTTATLIYRMLRQDGKNAFLGGNIGTPLLSRVTEMSKTDWVVLELSSFQLEDLEVSPHIAVVLSITQDHLANYDPLATNFHPTVEDYREAKKQIVLHQGPSDIAIVHKDNPASFSFARSTKARVRTYGRDEECDGQIKGREVSIRVGMSHERIGDLRDMRLLGKHNLENVAAASLAALETGTSLSAIRTVVKEFPGLPHRLENVCERSGVTFINDSFSTTPETSIAALEAFDKPVILIAGGSEKGSDFTRMGTCIAQRRVKKVIVIGQMTDRIVQALENASYSGRIITGLTTMKDIVAHARQDAVSGDVILLSPGCASFGLFKNYKERGEQFAYEATHS